MEVVTFATHAAGWFDAFRESCERNSLRLTVLGWGERWRGFMHKVRLMQAYVEGLAPGRGGVPPGRHRRAWDTIVLVTDAYDVLMLCGEGEILARYGQLAGGDGDGPPRVLMGGENPLAFGPRVMDRVGRLVFGSCHGRVVNAGVYVGPAGRLAELFRLWRELAGYDDATDDQKVLNRLCAERRGWFDAHVFIDRVGAFVFTAVPPTLYDFLFRSDRIGLDRRTLRNPRTGRVPCVLHMPARPGPTSTPGRGGPGSLDMNPYCDRLGLSRSTPRNWLVLTATNFPGEVAAGVAVLGLVLAVLAHRISAATAQNRK